jgi:hypothetical protein
MKTINEDGLLLCDIQGKIFENSIDYVTISSEMFIRRYMLSKIVKSLDNQSFLDDTLTIDNVFDEIDKEYGPLVYGKIKYNKEVLYWIGYIYRYFAFTYELSSRQVYRMIKPKELNEAYYVYHTFDCQQAIERLLESKGIYFTPEKQNERLLRLIRNYEYNDKMILKESNASLDDIIPIGNYSKNYFKGKEYIFDIEYKNEIIGKVILFNKYKDKMNIFILLEETRFLNKTMSKTILSKSLKLTLEKFNIHSLEAIISRDDEKAIHIFKNNGYKYLKEDDKFVYLLNKY